MAHFGVPSAQVEPASAIEAETMRKVMWRLLPFLMLCYFIAYVDRVNAGFAALTMNRDVGLTQAMFGIGGGLFFVAYVLFEVPSNLAMEKVGARLWIARIMITWGLVGIGTAFIVGPYTFYLSRFLLGAAEAGFFPGVILYLTYWFPSRYRARVVATFMVAIPVSSFLGSPLSCGPARVGGGWGLSRLAVAFHHRSCASDIAWPYGFLCPAKPSRRGQMAHARAKRVAPRPP